MASKVRSGGGVNFGSPRRALENHIRCKSEQALMWNSHVDVCPALTFALHEHL